MDAEGVTYSGDAEETPFVYGLNDEATREAFPQDAEDCTLRTGSANLCSFSLPE